VQGVYTVAGMINYPQSSAFNAAALQPYTVNGVSKGEYKTAGNLNFLKVYGAGHEVPYYRK